MNDFPRASPEVCGRHRTAHQTSARWPHQLVSSGVVGEGPFGESGAVLAGRLCGGNQEHPGILGHVEGFVVDEVGMLKAADVAGAEVSAGIGGLDPVAAVLVFAPHPPADLRAAVGGVADRDVPTRRISGDPAVGLCYADRPTSAVVAIRCCKGSPG